MNNNEIKGSPGAYTTGIISGGPFYIYKKLAGIGSVSRRADIKQASCLLSEQVSDWLSPR